MTEAQPALLSAALIERDALVLAAHRKQGRRPFGGQWLLPMTVVGDRETAEEAVRRHVSAQFGVTVANEVFADTVYIEDPDKEAAQTLGVSPSTVVRDWRMARAWLQSALDDPAGGTGEDDGS